MHSAQRQWENSLAKHTLGQHPPTNCVAACWGFEWLLVLFATSVLSLFMSVFLGWVSMSKAQPVEQVGSVSHSTL